MQYIRHPRAWLAGIVLAVAVSSGVLSWTTRPLLWPPPSRIVRIGVDHAPPYQSWVEGKGPVGFSVDVLNRAAERRGIRLDWVNEPLGPRQAFQRNKVDLWPLLSVKATRDFGHYPAKPWLQNQYAVVWRGDGSGVPTPEPNWTGKILSVVHLPYSFGLARGLFPASIADATENRTVAVQHVCEARSDGAFVELRLLEGMLLHRPPGCGEKDLRVRVLPGLRNELTVAATHEFRREADLLSDEIREMFLDGTFSGIIDRWFVFSSIEAHTLAQLGEERRNNVAAMFAIGGVLVALAIVFYLYRRARKATVEARAATLARGEFLANVSHEVRTPMNGVVGMADLLLETNLTPDQRDYCVTIRDSAQLQLAVLNDILDLSRIESGRFELQPIASAVHELFRSTTRPFGGLAAQKGLQFILEIDQAPKAVIWDPVRVSQILTNLLDNAFKFTSAGCVTVRAWSDQPDELRLSVADTGIGISPSAQARIFEKFMQADYSTTRRFGGTGLGLSICRQLATAMGGDISVVSAPGEGSIFTCRIAVETIDPALVPRSTLAQKTLTLSSDLPVLLAEDNRTNQKVALGLLRSLGLSVTTVDNGQQALLMHAMNNYSVILMDCQMPEMDGYEATRRIRESEGKGRRTPILALTAGATGGERTLALNAGMDGFISKPVRRDELAAALTPFLSPVASKPTSKRDSSRSISAGHER